jgi:hypothetical protein
LVLADLPELLPVPSENRMMFLYIVSSHRR